MAVIGINYSGGEHDYDEEGNFIEITPVSYENVYLHTQKEKFIFNSGNFVKDWFQAKMKYAKEIQEIEPYLSGSSTCDHFIMDGAKYGSAYLHIEEGKAVLKYVDTTDPDYLFTQSDIYENGWEMFVEPGTKPTWEELKKSCTNEGAAD